MTSIGEGYGIGGVIAPSMVTVIMPIRNEESSIAQSLEAVLTQEYPPHLMEVLIADGESTDSTKMVVEAVSRRFSQTSLKVITNKGRTAAAGMNCAINQASGDIIIRVDGHARVDPKYIAIALEVLQRTGADHVGGPVLAEGVGRFGASVAIAAVLPFGMGGGGFRYSGREEPVDSVSMGAWRREVFDKIGLFDEELVRDQDEEFNYRLISSGGKIMHSPQMKCRYLNRSSPKSLWRQQLQYGYWKVRVCQRHPRQMHARHFVPAVFVVTVAGSLALSFFYAPARSILAAITGSYATLSIVSAAWFSARNHEPTAEVALLPVVFLIIHLSYGVGFLWGLVAFRGRWGAGRHLSLSAMGQTAGK